MNCRETDRQIMAFLEGSLPEKEISLISNHLKECKRCKEYSSLLEKSLHQINIEKVVEEDQQFLSGIFEKVDLKSKPAKGFRRLLPTLAAASVILFAVFTGINIAKYSLGTYISSGNSLESDMLFANEISLEPIEYFFLIDKSSENE